MFAVRLSALPRLRRAFALLLGVVLAITAAGPVGACAFVPTQPLGIERVAAGGHHDRPGAPEHASHHRPADAPIPAHCTATMHCTSAVLLAPAEISAGDLAHVERTTAQGRILRASDGVSEPDFPPPRV